MPLNAQEIRNAIFPGVWRDYLRQMAASSEFLQATESKISPARQDDVELVLRFVALYELGFSNYRSANQTLDEFLNTTVERSLSQWTPLQWNEISVVFKRSLEAASALFGYHAFRKSVGGAKRTPINRGLFESELVAIAGLTDTQIATLIEHKDLVNEQLATALNSHEVFKRALLYATGSAEAANVRLQTIRGILESTLNA